MRDNEQGKPKMKIGTKSEKWCQQAIKEIIAKLAILSFIIQKLL